MSSMCVFFMYCVCIYCVLFCWKSSLLLCLQHPIVVQIFVYLCFCLFFFFFNINMNIIFFPTKCCLLRVFGLACFCVFGWLSMCLWISAFLSAILQQWPCFSSFFSYLFIYFTCDKWENDDNCHNEQKKKRENKCEKEKWCRWLENDFVSLFLFV